MDYVDLSLAGLSVMVGMPAARDLPPATVKSLLGTFTKCQAVNVPCQLGMVTGSAIVQWARDEVLDLFLASDANRLFWIDSDMVWEPAQFLRLLALSQVREIVCAAYPAKREQPTFFLNYDKKALTQDAYGLLEINGIGLGFSVMRREVVEHVARNAGRVIDEVSGKEMPSVFRIDTCGRNRRGEDIAFFHDLRALGYRVWLDPFVDLGHIGTKTYTGSIRDALHRA